MKIKRTAWHYKLLYRRRAHEPYRESLCGYFWNVAFLISLMGLLIALLACALYLYLTDVNIISNTIMVTFIISSIVLPWYTIRKLRTTLSGPVEIPGENIAVAYVKAKKAKICPIIEFID